MTKIKEIAKYLIKSYEINNNAEFEKSELKLQKLMYFAQRGYCYYRRTFI